MCSEKPNSECEMEITPEMIAAGLHELAWFDEDFESREDFLERLYSAMSLASSAHEVQT